ncbi:MAG: 4-alpha-glucanotransferase [Oscillospiraceae bacterium]|nr:4-alpha-glucanotransferase [Oscillospiraceae bacterium]
MRNSGILMHITSLPSPYGVGTMGKEAYRFVDFLKKAGQRYWQILPVTPTGYGDSPYQSCSTFAGNHYLIDLDMLVEEGLLKKSEITKIKWFDTPERVNFGHLYNHRLDVLRLAYQRAEPTEGFEAFCRANESWVYDYACFMALKAENGGKPWYQWEDGLKYRNDPAAMAIAWNRLNDEITFHLFLQYLFHRQWEALRAYAHKNGVQIIGDVPIYVPYDSAEVWSNPHLFYLDEKLDPIAVAGCPPDGFNADGQLWGNPLYRWEVHKQENFSWWVQRMGAAGERYDMVRLDHFRGFESYWAIPYGDATARNGKWMPGPGMDFVDAMHHQLPQIPMIAEDLGFLTKEVKDLQKASGYPGMKVLTFAFDSREPSDYLPHTYTQNSVCYTGTHDNMTTRQWFDTAPKGAVKYAREYMGIRPEEGDVWGTIRTAMAGVSDLCVIPIQDYLELGGEARMNFPGTQSGDNWTWRATKGYLNAALSKRIYRLTELYGRLEIEKEETNGKADHLPLEMEI